MGTAPFCSLLGAAFVGIGCTVDGADMAGAGEMAVAFFDITVAY